MSDGQGGGMVRLWVFILVLNLIFPVLGYTFTSFGETEERYELELDADSLQAIGLNLVDAESHNFTFGLPYINYELVNDSIRAKWDTHRLVALIFEDGIRFQKQSAISKAFDIWLTPYTVSVKSIRSNEWFKTLKNETIIRDFDPEFNWSRFVLQDGHHVFVTPFSADGNITKAVLEDGQLNVTIAKSFDRDDTTFNFWRFVGWYTALLMGDQSWGLPSVFAWVIRIIGALSIFAAIMLARRMIPL